MAVLSTAHLAFVFGVLGNIVSFLVYVAPAPTFYRIYKKKSTEGFQSIPYSVALFSAMLYLYYAFLKTDVIMLITINSVGCVVEFFYLTLFMIYATKESKIFTVKLLVIFNMSAYSLIIAFTYYLADGRKRVSIVGWICAAFSVSVFAAPLSIMRRVIKTKSVEYMPFSLSLCLTLCAVMWFFYGILIKDYYVAAPNVLGFSFGMAQMLLYGIYKGKQCQQQQRVATETSAAESGGEETKAIELPGGVVNVAALEIMQERLAARRNDNNNNVADGRAFLIVEMENHGERPATPPHIVEVGN